MCIERRLRTAAKPQRGDTYLSESRISRITIPSLMCWSPFISRPNRLIFFLDEHELHSRK